ncbi:MAG: hypothetical protein K1X51_03050 [Rhodospirillaceae bacterium]|nr:hypothetical protein [Rhodospirillaceae bacterium]
MFQSTSNWFGWKIEPGTGDSSDANQVTVQITIKAREDWINFGPKFPAAHLDDLLHSIQKAHRLMQDEFTKHEGGWKPRNMFL